MKVKNLEDRQRLSQMLQLAEPVEQTIKLYFDRRPEMREKFSNCETDIPDSDNISLAANSHSHINKTSLIHSRKSSNVISMNSRNIKNNFTLKGTNPNAVTVRNSSRPKTATAATAISKTSTAFSNNDLKKVTSKTTLKSFAPKLENRISPMEEKQQIVRTVLMPEMQINNVNVSIEENEFLRKQLIDMKNYYENHILKLEEDRRLREEEHRLWVIDFKEKLEDSIKKNQKLEKMNYELTKDFMQLKFDSSNGEKEKFEEVENLKCQNEALAVSLKEVIFRTNVDKESARVEYERKTKEISNIMRSQVIK